VAQNGSRATTARATTARATTARATTARATTARATTARATTLRNTALLAPHSPFVRRKGAKRSEWKGMVRRAANEECCLDVYGLRNRLYG
jgi:hypothetical protein